MPGKKIRNTKILSFFTVLLVLIMGLISIYSLRQLEKSIVGSLHTKDVAKVCDELYISVIEAETNLRALVLTKETAFQSRYSSAAAKVPRLLDSVRSMTSEDDNQQKNLDDLALTVRERLIMFEEVYNYANRNRNTDSLLIAPRIRVALDISDKLKKQIAVVTSTELEILAMNAKGLSRYLTILPGLFIFIALISFGTAGLAFYSIYQYNIAQRQSDNKIAAYQNQLKEQIQRLNISNNELAQFAYVASHDLQEPLRKISAFSDLLIDQYKSKLDEEGELYLSRINSSARRMRNLITDLLNYSRVSRSSPVEDIDLSVAFNQVKEDLEILIKEKNAVVTASALPSVRGDISEFRQLFQNLLTNALKFSKKDQPPVISITTSPSTSNELSRLTQIDPTLNYVSIHFKDNGIGFEPEYAEKIFVIFQRLHGRDVYEGTGIGLAICKKIAEKYGGTIYATSSLNNGATFTIILPQSHSVL